MTRTFGHESTLRYLRSERTEEYKAAWMAVAIAILFAGICVASIISISREIHLIFPAILSAGIMAGCGFRAASCVSFARNLTRQIRNLEEDTRL